MANAAFKQEFRKFLIKHKAFGHYHRALLTQEGIGFSECVDEYEDNAYAIICGSIDWSRASEDVDWDDLNDMWRDHYYESELVS